MSSSCGFLRLHKAQGDSSFKALFPVKRAFRGNKVGHAGTLDPDATGLLIVAIGPATRLLSYAEDWDKTYCFRLHLGFSTDSYDTCGQILERAEVPSLNESQIQSVIPQFCGLIRQTPPAFSALKIDGKRAYELARKGEHVEMKSREVHIRHLEFLGFASDAENALDFRVRCSKGTYVRSLGVDLAKALGTLGTVSKIHREAIGEHGLDGAFDPFAEGQVFELEPVEKFIPLPQISAPAELLEKMFHGNAVAFPGTENLPDGSAHFVLNPEGQAFCMAIAKGGRLQPKIRMVE